MVMAGMNGTGDGLPEGIFSLLDTDLYKLTMQCAVLKFFPEVGRLNHPLETPDSLLL